jgi:two-component system, sensor histidine kinase and response regulator
MINNAATQGKRVLMVDDQEINLRTVGGILRLGFNVSLADDGDKALALMEANSFDLVLLDVRMPTRDGFDICQAIRANPLWSDIPIIFLSADNDKDLIVRALEAGGVDYITKPFNSAELVSRVRTHIALKVARDELRQLAEDKDELLGILTHDLKNHLSGIKISAQVLHGKLEKEGDAGSAAMAANIHTGTDQMFAFVVEFLANCAADRGFNVKASPIWLDELSAAATRHYEEAARRKRITLAHRGKVTDPTSTDQSAVKQILHNLISNAVKFSPAGATVRVSVETDAEGAAVWRVQDEGPGFTAEDRSAMFRRYQRLSAQPTAEEPSTGLGLSIVKKLVDQLGGAIECESEPGRGTTFTLRFPPFALIAADDFAVGAAERAIA